MYDMRRNRVRTATTILILLIMSVAAGWAMSTVGFRMLGSHNRTLIDPKLAGVLSSLIGEWRRVDGEVLELRADSTATENQRGSVRPAKWTLFTGDAPEPVGFPIDRDAVFLRLEIGGAVQYFRIETLTGRQMTLVDAERGTSELFSRAE